uniref:Uncharacterized protein n=1 Tax=Glossina austeni TaxID=7395 RepID=A0A1A9VH07_GLOAU
MANVLKTTGDNFGIPACFLKCALFIIGGYNRIARFYIVGNSEYYININASELVEISTVKKISAPPVTRSGKTTRLTGTNTITEGRNQKYSVSTSRTTLVSTFHKISARNVMIWIQ